MHSSTMGFKLVCLKSVNKVSTPMRKLEKWNKIKKLLRLYIKDSGVYPNIRNFGWEPKLSVWPQQEHLLRVPHHAVYFKYDPNQKQRRAVLSGNGSGIETHFHFTLQEPSAATFAHQQKPRGEGPKLPPPRARPHVSTQVSPGAETHPDQQTVFFSPIILHGIYYQWLLLFSPVPTYPPLLGSALENWKIGSIGWKTDISVGHLSHKISLSHWYWKACIC